MRIYLLKFFDRFIGRILLLGVLKPSSRPVSKPLSFLFIRPGGIGDAVLLVPALRAVLKSDPDVCVDVLAERRNVSVFQLCPGLRSVACYDNFYDYFKIFFRRYDVVVDTEQWHRLSAITARLIKSSIKVGFATNERRRCFTHLVPYRHEDPELVSFMNLLGPLGFEVNTAWGVPFLEVPLADVVSCSDNVQGDKRFRVALFPGASIPERRWGAKKFRALAQGLLAHGIGVVIVGGPQDVDVSCEVSKHLDVLDLSGKISLTQTAAVLKGCSLLICGDSGVLHLAVGLGVPTVSFFGPGIEAKWAPRGRGHRVINKNLGCSPCTRFGYTPACGRHVECMREIEPEAVLLEALDVLEGTKRQ